MATGMEFDCPSEITEGEGLKLVARLREDAGRSERDKPASGVFVQFTIDGTPRGAQVVSNHLGHAPLEISGLTAGKYAVGVQVVLTAGPGTFKTQKVLVKAKAQPEPHHLDVQVIDLPGGYELQVGVVDETGKTRIAGLNLLIMDGGDREMRVSVAGTVSYAVKTFGPAEVSREIEVHVESALNVRRWRQVLVNPNIKPARRL